MIRRMAFSLVPLVLVLAALEGLLRFVSDEAPLPRLSEMHQGTAMEGHPTRMWALRHDMETQFGAATRVRADGLREVVLTGADLRILTLGDSSIFGHALENDDTLHHALGQSLARRDVAVDVHCGGVPGYSTEQSLVLLEEVGWALEPDLLVIGNLWSDNNYDHFVDAEWMDLLDAPLLKADRFFNRSHTWRWLRGHVAGQSASSEDFSPVGWIRDPYETGHRRVPLSDYANNLDRMLLEASERGVGAVVFQPANPMRLRNAAYEANWLAYFDIQRGIAERRNVPVVDGAQVLNALSLGAADAFLDDLHPTGAANRAYAEALATTLSERGWPEASLVPDTEPPLYEKRLRDDWAVPE
jgi:hypothetical protein